MLKREGVDEGDGGLDKGVDENAEYFLQALK